MGVEHRRERARSRILAKSGQALVTDEDVRMFRIVVIVIGWEHRILAGSHRVMTRIVPAAAAQASKDAVMIAAIPIVRMGAAERPLRSTDARQEHAGENDTDLQFGDALHHRIRPRYQWREGR